MKDCEIENKPDPTICITGGIGAGKSVVSRVLRCNGFSVFDCDSEAKSLMTNDEDVKKALLNTLGIPVYLPDGQLDRKTLSSIIFSDEEKRKVVNQIVHKAVKDKIIYERQKTVGTFFIESAIPVTGGLDILCTNIWIVNSPMEERIKRVEKRDGLSRDEIKKRIASQQKELERIPKEKTIDLINDDTHPLLIKVLNLTNKYNHLHINSYVERNYSHNRQTGFV